MASSNVFGTALLVALSVFATGACTRGGERAADAPKRENPPLAAASGAPVMAYSVVKREMDLGREWIYVVPKEEPSSRQELIDLAVDLRTKFPSSSAEIVDSSAAVDKVAAVYRGDETVSEDFVNEHEIATLNTFIDVGGLRWMLVGPHGREIARLSPVIPPNPEKLRALALRDAAQQRRRIQCESLKRKPIAEMSARDLESIEACKADGE